MKNELNQAAYLINTKTVSVTDAASFLGCTSRKLYSLIETGKIQAYLVGPYYRIESKSLDDYANSLTVSAA